MTFMFKRGKMNQLAIQWVYFWTYFKKCFSVYDIVRIKQLYSKVFSWMAL